MSLDLQDASDVDIIIEAAVENMEIKQSIFKQLDGIAPAHAILATNTSSLPITEIAKSNKASRASNWYAFYESCTSYETCRNHSRLSNNR